MASHQLGNFVDQTQQSFPQRQGSLYGVDLLQAYQLFKARAYGADAVLLIAAVLPNNDLDYLAAAARKLGLQCLIEVSLLHAAAHGKSS